VSHHVVRVIAAAASDLPVSDGRRGRRVDYAALLRRGRTPPSRLDGDGNPDSDAQSGEDTSDAAGNLPQPPTQSGGWHRPSGPDDTLAERIGTVSSPIVEAVYLQQQHFLTLSRRIAAEIAAFCGNRSVSQSGTWDVRLPLDPNVLPGTLLLLSLSPVCLSLRFEVADVNTKQLLLHHSSVLQRELTTLLDAWGTPRDVDITIW
jgi:type III secretion control protein HpaP